MATNTTNFNLSKPAYTDTADIAVINSNMDKVDTALQGLGSGLAIISKNNTHVAITAGQYVYVHGHGSLAEGLYTAKSNIAANATLSTSNLQAEGSGGLNALSGKLSYKNLGSFTTESGLASALDAEIATMSNYTQEAIRFNFTTANGAFGAYYYMGVLSRGSSDSYCSLFVETYSNKTDPHSIDGSKNGTWGFNSWISNIRRFVPSKSIIGTSGTSATITVPSGCRAYIVGTSATAGRSFAGVLISNSNGNVDILETAKGSEITFNKSVANRLTISTTTTGTMHFLVFALDSDTLNNINKV